ncbi:hypothetical protein [Corynebacterium glaucum]|uniref:hypothetical protein n=1 Tax=Corynebacterium glaucum TaxID=187491 RepID=UPI0025B2A849|nr:hypothetical protein [Corynebacterium glaucum]WJZ06747.1 hypothetical protein CGLAUT_01185 [Corynebacterium glaucum]
MLSANPAVNDLEEFLAHHGWKPAGDHALVLPGPHLTTRLELSAPRLQVSNEGESVVAYFSLINPALQSTTNDGSIYTGAPHTLINAAIIGKIPTALATAIQLTIDGAPYTERYAQLHHDLKTFTDNITAAWVAQCIPVSERCEGNQPYTSAANLVTTLHAEGSSHLANEVLDDFLRYAYAGLPAPSSSEKAHFDAAAQLLGNTADTTMAAAQTEPPPLSVPRHTMAMYIPSDDVENDTIFTVVDTGINAGGGTDPRLIEYADICDLLDEFTNVRLRSPRLLTAEIHWHKPMPKELLESAARDGLGVCNLTTGDYYLAGDETGRFTSEITHRLGYASPTTAIRALGRIERESIIAAGEPNTAIFLLDDLTSDALGIRYSFSRRTFTIDHRNIADKNQLITGYDCGRAEAAQLIDLFLTSPETARDFIHTHRRT